jgi:preprotein translocase subunit SecA
MTRADIPIPGLLWGDYPERRPEQRTLAERCNAALRTVADRSSAWLRQRDAAFLARVRAAEAGHALAGLDDAALRSLRHELARHGLRPATLARCFALVSIAARQTLGHRPFDTQLVAARAVVENRLAEMATGEGKTLAIAVAAATAALAGMPVHVVTANDYLVTRDAEALGPLYTALGLSVGAVVQADDGKRRAKAYACDITYVTAKELVFDYLRDGLGQAERSDAMAAPLARLCAEPGNIAAPRLLRGLCMAIIDEADAILIDEARVPLILSQPGDMAAAHDHADQALRYARTLRRGTDFTLEPETLTARLTANGEQRLARATASLDGASAAPAWLNRFHREHSVCTALAALHLYARDRHYLVRDGKVAIIDETTGRVAEGRVWSNGLQQLVEFKEGCPPTPAMATIAQITYQRFFPRYFRLGGLSGTLCEARAELLATYGLSVRRIALRKPCMRRVGATRLFPNHASLWAAVAERVADLHRRGTPLLVATDSVAETQALADLLAQRKLPHAVLHARCDRDEAELVARAGQRGAITVTTNMAGRGTDIALGEGVTALGGLHLIGCQLNSARRIDRQLAGRAARQGDPGSVETWLSLDTTLLAHFWPAPVRAAAQRWAHALPSWAVRGLARVPQRFEEHRQREQRERLTRHDLSMERGLAFGGRGE